MLNLHLRHTFWIGIRVSLALASIGLLALSTPTLTRVAMTEAPASQEIAPIDPVCSSSLPCIEYDNNGTGPGIRGISLHGNGLAGATRSNSTTAANGREGLIGNDISTSGVFNAGVRGLSIRGAGVDGQSSSGTGVSGTSTDGSGLLGTSTNNPGVFGTSSGYVGVLGASTSTYGGFFSGASGILVEADTGNALKAFSFGSGAALVASASTGDGLDAATSGGIGAYIQNSGGNGADIRGSYIGSVSRAPAGGFPIVATGPSGNNLFYVDGAGNVFAHGTYGNFAVTRNGKVAITYGATTASPIVEDTGSAQLINGMAVVNLDSAFAQTIDPRTPYHVLLTPDGDTRGLFVANKGPSAFVVREVQGGHGSFTFDYHIYAAVLGHPNERMAILSQASGALVMPKAPPVMRKISRPEHEIIPRVFPQPRH